MIDFIIILEMMTKKNNNNENYLNLKIKFKNKF
jgi:hypothetical protein